MTLTEVSNYVRKYLPYVILGSIIILIIYYIVQIAFLVYRSGQKNIVTDTVFGVISKPIVKDASTSSGIEFTLDTIEGAPITATDTARVFFLPPSPARFGYRENVFLMAQNIGVNTQSAKYRLVNKQANFETDKQKLTVDIGNFNFTYQYFFENEPKLFENYEIPISDEATVAAIGFLQSVGRYPEELIKGETQSIYFFHDSNTETLNQVQKNSEANLVEIDFFRPQIDGIPTVSYKFPNSHNFVLGYFDAETKFQVLNAQMSFFEKSEAQVGIYPLKTGKQAYESLRKGEALVVKNPSGAKNITIKKMFLAYYDPNIYQDYLQPVFVFIGEPEFVAFIPAVSDEYLAK